jgi:predicted dehydrogenase
MTTALIGCGRIGFLLEEDPLRYKPCTHYGGATAAGMEITHACDIDRDRLNRFGDAAGVPRGNRYAGYRELLADARPDAVIIASWTETHAPIAIEAARRGAKVIVLEKPMAPSLRECRAIIDECDGRGAALIISHERRYDSRYRKVRDMIERGAIGEVRTVHATMLTGGHRGRSLVARGGGPLLHDGTHLVDMVRFLFGEITSVQGEFRRDSRRSGFEDRASAWLTTGGGVDIFLEAGGPRDYFQFELEISGSRGKIVIGNGYERLYAPRASRFYTGFRDLDEAPFPAFKRNNCFRALYGEARQALRGKASPASSGRDGYRALEVIHAIYLSSHLNRKTLSLPIAPGAVNLKKIFGLR